MLKVSVEFKHNISLSGIHLSYLTLY